MLPYLPRNAHALRQAPRLLRPAQCYLRPPRCFRPRASASPRRRRRAARRCPRRAAPRGGAAPRARATTARASRAAPRASRTCLPPAAPPQQRGRALACGRVVDACRGVRALAARWGDAEARDRKPPRAYTSYSWTDEAERVSPGESGEAEVSRKCLGSVSEVSRKCLTSAAAAARRAAPPPRLRPPLHPPAAAPADTPEVHAIWNGRRGTQACLGSALRATAASFTATATCASTAAASRRCAAAASTSLSCQPPGGGGDAASPSPRATSSPCGSRSRARRCCRLPAPRLPLPACC